MLIHRLCKFSRTLLPALCVLVTCGLTLSCEDDYIYDDEEPSWLGSSIYDFLHDAGNYTNYVRIIDDLNYSEVLSRTGSKTLFVADDDAFAQFYLGNEWNVSKYEDLSSSQKKLLLYGSMLGNAYLLDMMSSIAGTPPSEGVCLRHVTEVSVVDSIPFFKGPELPQNNKYWNRFRESGVRLAIDNTDPMIVHFLHEYLSKNNITDEDFAIIYNRVKTRQGEEAFIYNRKVISSGVSYEEYSEDTLTITCKNGYIYRLDGVLVPPSNMAEELRTNEKTQLFSRLIDRFSFPAYSSTLTEDYNRIYHADDDANAERVYEKRYFSDFARGGNALESYTEDGVNYTLDASLLFDPGWNQLSPSTSTTYTDINAMFVPNDDVITDYFTTGGGAFLVERYGGPHYGATDWPLERSLDSIPIDIIEAFVNNLMKTSFVASVPSKFDKITNDARDPMGVTVNNVDECILANNGVIYVLNTVFGPAKYVAVSAPPLVQENMRIINFAITNSSYLLNYNSYLLAMDSYFSFIVPGDDYFVYYDPVTLEQDEHLAYTFHFGRPTPSSTTDIVWAKRTTYDPLTYELGDSTGVITYTSNSTLILNRLHDLMEYFIVVGDFDNGNKYHLSKGYGTVKVQNAGAGVTQIYGGEQIENGRQVNVLTIYDQTEAGNGKTYLTDALPTPPTKSVYSIMSSTPEFSQFFDLCQLEDSVVYLAFPNAKTHWADSLKKYSIFYKGATGNNGRDYNVPFFSTYHYTVYIPSNEAMDAAYECGLPRNWEEVMTYKDSPDTLAYYLRTINKFLRYHFQDNSVYVDNLPFSVTEAGVVNYRVDYETAALNENTGRFYNVTLETQNGTLTVTDEVGNTSSIVNDDPATEGKLYNIMARDLTFNNNNPKSASSIETSSFATLHLVDKVLLNSGVGEIGADGKWHFYTIDYPEK